MILCVLWLLKASRVFENFGFGQKFRRRGYKITAFLILIGLVFAAVTGNGLMETHDSCYNGATTGRSAWMKTFIGLTFQFLIIASVLFIMNERLSWFTGHRLKDNRRATSGSTAAIELQNLN